jgi:hypothetical protein
MVNKPQTGVITTKMLTIGPGCPGVPGVPGNPRGPYMSINTSLTYYVTNHKSNMHEHFQLTNVTQSLPPSIYIIDIDRHNGIKTMYRQLLLFII